MDGFKNTTKTSYDTASGRKFANGGMTVSRNDMAGGEGPMSKPAMVAKYAKGKTRKEIAVDLGAHPSAITRRLGAVRSYRGNRLKEEVN